MGLSYTVNLTRSNTMLFTVLITSISGVLFFSIPDEHYAHSAFMNVYEKQFPLGEVAYYDPTGTTITVSGISDGYTNMVKIDPTTTFISTTDFSNGGSNDATLEYTGLLPKYFHIAASVSTSATNNNDILIYSIAKNGVQIDGSKIMMKLGQSTDVTSSAMHVVAYLEAGDTVEVYVGNYSGSADVIVKSLNFVAVSMK